LPKPLALCGRMTTGRKRGTFLLQIGCSNRTIVDESYDDR
jgi:hypothetical protein